MDSGNTINYVTGATYGPDSALTGFVSGNSGTFAGITSAFSYNKRLQPIDHVGQCAQPDRLSPSAMTSTLGNGTSGSGQRQRLRHHQLQGHSHGRNQTFTYDALNRLISAQNAGTNCAAMVLGGKTEYWGNSYGYDAWGNLLQKTVTKCGAENLSVTADAHNWLTPPARIINMTLPAT